jgi:hypothetical protein
MSTVDSILDLLNKWPKWKRITEAPDRVDELTRRLATLEGKLLRAPGDACPKCGALDFRVESSKRHPMMGDMGVIVRTMRCGDCSFKEEKTVTPSRQ